MNQEQIDFVVTAYTTPFDSYPENKAKAQDRYQQGLQMAAEYEYISIAINGVWGGQKKNGASVGSYEKLGYHAGTAPMIKGWLEGGVTIIDYRVKHGYAHCSCGQYWKNALGENNQCPRCGGEPLPTFEEQ